LIALLLSTFSASKGCIHEAEVGIARHADLHPSENRLIMFLSLSGNRDRIRCHFLA
jgi:hypothetical protein